MNISVLHTIAYFLILIAIDYKRTPKLKLFSKDWIIIFVLVIISGVLLTLNFHP